MYHLFLQTLLLSSYVGVVLLQNVTDCSVEGVDVPSLPDGEPLVLNTPVYDNIKSVTFVPKSGFFKVGKSVKSLKVIRNRYVYSSPNLELLVEPIKEAIEISHPGEHFYYNFTLLVNCSGNVYEVGTVIPIIETNTFTPTFLKQSYEYTLFSNFVEDLNRLQEINPIRAIDQDISNTEVIFSIEPNDYFSLQYEGIIPGSLNKNHSAKLIVKQSLSTLTQTLKLTMFVMDMGQPRKSSSATLVVKPIGTTVPTFEEPYYMGDYYLNNSFVMRSLPQLEAVPDSYEINATLTGPEFSGYFEPVWMTNGTVNIRNIDNIPEIEVYRRNYLLYTLTVTYVNTNLNKFVTKGSATVIIEMRKD